MPRRSEGRYRPQYLEKIKISRGPRRVGEVFAIKLKGVGYMFGRVIRDACATAPSSESPTGGPWALHPGVYLVYVYRDVSATINRIPDLHRQNLLLPPEMIIGAGWTHGYFVPVRQDRLTPEDLLPVHCFSRKFGKPDGTDVTRYVDEYGCTLPRRAEPCTASGVGSFGSLAIQIAKALGLPYKEE